MEIKENEVHKVQAAGSDDSRNRYIKGEGPAVILEIKGWCYMGDMFKYLDKLTMMEPRVIKQKLKRDYSLTEEETEKVYRKWKKEFLKHGYKGI